MTTALGYKVMIGRTICLAVLLLLGCGNPQKKKEKEPVSDTIVQKKPKTEMAGEHLKASVQVAIFEIIHLLKTKNLDALNREFIHKEFGFFDVYRIGAFDTFEKRKQILLEEDMGFQETIYERLFGIESDFDSSGLEWHHASFDCGNFVWDRQGFFVSDSLGYPSLTKIMQYRKEYEPETYSDALFEDSSFLEKSSYRVVLTQFDIIFYLTKIDDKWSITGIDRVSTDCSA